jgi:hypothetical protein
MNMSKEKVFRNQSASKLNKTSDHRNSLSKEEITYSAPELEVGREYREGGGVIKYKMAGMEVSGECSPHVSVKAIMM